VDWLVRPTRVGTNADTSHSLRMKAREFLRLAGEARDPIVVTELNNLAQEYDRQAERLDAQGRARAEKARALD
jgi:hypothetical protein